jgi:hypothetical protein
VSGWRVAGASVRPTVSDDTIHLAITLVRGEDGDEEPDGEPGLPLVADLLESYKRQQRGKKGRHAGS